MLNSIPEAATGDAESKEAAAQEISSLFARNRDPVEAELEAAELNRYLLAKSFFDCREFDRCAAVFLPDAVLAGIMTTPPDDVTNSATNNRAGGASGERAAKATDLPQLSQKALFLALYAKVMSGEKRKDEDAEMVMGPHDLGSATNSQLRVVSAYLNQWVNQITGEDGEHVGSQGWLEYL